MKIKQILSSLLIVIYFLFLGDVATSAFAQAQNNGPVATGYSNLIHKAYQDPLITKQIYDLIWQTWEPELKAQAEKATPEQRGQMTRDRYGFTLAPFENEGLPMGFVKIKGDAWAMSCLMCHGGTVAGVPTVGAPNHLLDLQTFYEDLTILKFILQGQIPPTRPVDLGVVLSAGRGSTNAFTFSATLLSLRNPDLSMRATPLDFQIRQDAELDPPPWWNVQKKTHFYSDGFAKKSPRALMQFTLGPLATKEMITQVWAPDFTDILRWMEKLNPPRFPGKVDRQIAAQGRNIFLKTCSKCHGDPQTPTSYPNRVVPLSTVQTDPARLQNVTLQFRKYYGESWLGEGDINSVVLNPIGYVAPPLNGIWASAPYFHNGSVPTLWDVLNPKLRPAVWRIRSDSQYDFDKMGLLVESFVTAPKTKYEFEARQVFNTTQPSKSNAGHPFADALTDRQKREVLEFLKTL